MSKVVSQNPDILGGEPVFVELENWGQSTFLDSRRGKTLAGYRLLPS